MTALTFLVLGLAAYRAARAVSIDSITRPLRDKLELSGSRWFDELIHCGFCTSFWTAGMSYLVWVLAAGIDNVSILEHLIRWWAVAGLANFLIAVDTFLLREAPPR